MIARLMLKVPAEEFQTNIGRYQDMALTQPVAVTRHGRERTVLISADEYQRLKRRDRQVLALSDFTDAHIATLEATRAPDSSKAVDNEVYGPHMAFSCNLCANAFVNCFFSDPAVLLQRIASPEFLANALFARKDLPQAEITVMHVRNNLDMLARYNRRVIEQCYECVHYTRSPRA